MTALLATFRRLTRPNGGGLSESVLGCVLRVSSIGRPDGLRTPLARIFPRSRALQPRMRTTIRCPSSDLGAGADLVGPEPICPSSAKSRGQNNGSLPTPEPGAPHVRVDAFERPAPKCDSQTDPTSSAALVSRLEGRAEEAVMLGRLSTRQTTRAPGALNRASGGCGCA